MSMILVVIYHFRRLSILVGQVSLNLLELEVGQVKVSGFSANEI